MQNDLKDDLDRNMGELEKAKGEMLVNFMAEDLNKLKLYIFEFKPLNMSDTGETRKILLKAKSITFLKQDNKLENVFTSVGVEGIIGKKLMEYEDWHIEKYADTGNLSGPLYNLTLKFKDGYSIDIFSYR